MYVTKAYVLIISKGVTDMKTATKPLGERIAHADERGSYWLAKANEQAERGNHDKAEKYYEKGQLWLDRANKLLGNA